MALIDDRLSFIVEALGRYFSIISKEEFISVLAFGGEEDLAEFGTTSFEGDDVLKKLEEILEERKSANENESYVASLYAKGLDEIL